jgi:hypothetical protein
MIIADLIEGNRFTGLTSLVTLTSREITDGVQLLISGRTVSRIDLDPMSGVQTTTGGDMSFDASQKTSCFGFGPFAMSPITNAIFIGSTNVIQKRMIVSPTMTGGVLGHYVKRTTNDDFAVFVTTQIDQIVAIRKRKGHLGNSCLRC